MSTFQRDEDALEQLLDRQGLRVILEMLANICAHKAAHISEAWQDSRLAAKWQLASAKLERASKWAAMLDR